MTETADDSKKLLTEIIQKQIVILGPDIALMKAKSVPGLEVLEDGTVAKISGDPSETIRKLIDEYVALSGLIVRTTMEPLLSKYPEISQQLGNGTPKL
ncbi:MAG: hypothetical protein Q8P89_03525 [bacterium]|nr:hypothetical protein [bacterium]